jgi:transposase
MILLSARGMDVAMIAQVTFASPDRVRVVIHKFNTDGFDPLRPQYAVGRPPKFDTEQRGQIKQIALARPSDHGLPFSTWRLVEAGRLPGGTGGDRGHLSRGLRMLLREQGVSFPGRQDVEDQHGPRLSGQEPGPGAVRDH